jgi:hypothetical protein
MQYFFTADHITMITRLESKKRRHPAAVAEGDGELDLRNRAC